jgi:hypothetical protein
MVSTLYNELTEKTPPNEEDPSVQAGAQPFIAEPGEPATGRFRETRARGRNHQAQSEKCLLLLDLQRPV